MTILAARCPSAFTKVDHFSTGPLSEEGLSVQDSAGKVVRTWDDVVDDLLGLRHLEDDWDGEGAKAPGQVLVDYAIMIARDFKTSTTMKPPDFAIAGVNGSVSFEWQSEDFCAELELEAIGRLEFRHYNIETGEAEVCQL